MTTELEDDDVDMLFSQVPLPEEISTIMPELFGPIATDADIIAVQKAANTKKYWLSCKCLIKMG